MKGVWVLQGVVEGGKTVVWMSCMKEKIYFQYKNRSN